MKKELVSVVIRTLNEERYLAELLSAIQSQCIVQFNVEVVIVDSGSTDRTLDIAKEFGCRITYIKKEDFTFGRSLNYGCDFAQGDYLIFISGHCIPKGDQWLTKLVEPLVSDCAYTYGRQLGRDTTKFSECQLFEKYFPSQSRIPQEGFFCNNANSALRKSVWAKFPFDEELTGCEDMYLARQLVESGMLIAYVADAPVYHIHDETWERVLVRYEREAIALQKILPEVHVNLLDTINYIMIGIFKDMKAALKKGIFLRECYSICRFRYAQYAGAYKGNHINREISKRMKERYFYPRVTTMDIKK